MWGAGNCHATKLDEKDLGHEDERDNPLEPGGALDVFEDVQFILNLPGVDEVENLQEHENVEDQCHLSRRSINLF